MRTCLQYIESCVSILVVMAKSCDITGASSQVAGKYSNRVRATQFNPTGKRRTYANLQKKRIYVPELGKTIRLTVSAKGLKTINKKGAYKALKDAKILKEKKQKKTS